MNNKFIFIVMSEVEYLVTVNYGLADISAYEIERLIGRKPQVYSNYLRFNGSIDDAYKLVIWGRTIHKVLLILDEGGFNDLEDIGKRVSSLPYNEIYPRGMSFKLRTVRYGEHPFTSLDANRVVGGYINNSLNMLGLEPRVDLINPDIEFVLRIINDKYLFGVNLVGEGLHRRMYRKYKHPASIKTSIAASMIIISGWRDEPFIDPMAGGGTIPIEAAMYKYNFAPGLYREKHPLIKLKLFDPSEYMEFRKRVKEAKIDEKLDITIIYNDISKAYLEGALDNASNAGVSKFIDFMCIDARILHKYIKFEDGGIAVTNPPYGIRMTRMKVLPNLYNDTVSSLAAMGVSKIVVITARWREMQDAFEKNGYKLKSRREVLHGKLTAFILVGEA